MAARRRTRSITGPIIFGSASVALSAALLVGWVLVIVQNTQLTQEWVGNAWLLVAGVLSFTAIMTVLVLFSVFLARQIVEIRRQTTFVDSVTHELRSPLASLRMCLETLERRGIADHQREQLRDMMLEDVERLSAFIEDILQATRLGHGQAEGHTITRVALAPVVDRCARAVAKRHKIDRKQISDSVPAELELDTDPAALELILKNLLDNAVKYSDKPATIRVDATVHAGKTCIDVIDQGVGIPRGAIKRVFDRFYRVDEEEVRARRGTGLGLFVVQALVRELGGRLDAHSAGKGRGTRMSIQFPITGKASATAGEAEPEPVAEKAFG